MRGPANRLEAAQQESFRTCEVCGQPGELRENGLIKTLCDEHTSGQEVEETMAELSHEQLWHVRQREPGDYEPYGKRKRLTARQPALIVGVLGGMQVVPHPERTCPLDWGVGGNPASHRAGLLTFEHQGCAEFEPE